MPSTLTTMTESERAAALAGPPEEVARLLLEAAEAGHGEAQLLVGQLCLDGKGLAQDPVAALRWFGRAAQGGNAMAMNMVGRCCDHGWGTAIDKGLAAQWYEAAASHELDWGLYNLATLHALGEGVPQNRATALTLFQRAAAMGHAKSINMIGGFYEDGWIVPHDMDQAADHYRRAAEGGDFRGQFNHARMLIAQGDQDGARLWLDRMAQTATPAFLAKAQQWIDTTLGDGNSD
ncbi:tetratricopeptide repeat protein [Sphingobium sp. AP49]|uniref:tetratricopeptide repeat protein n=1 Tax=Sphingobium sp. AP49 TaxID=1144307 RepID=UPI00026EE308|nr:tetratricopeptide repeat protein [Sphingobium sp. AP49]WHO37648.1 tetratricopeptide repeat protein [Sphingobium sp. AP49]